MLSSSAEFDIDIIEIAHQCGIRIVKQEGRHLVGRCPFCGDSRKNLNHAHLYLEPQRGLYYCQRCGEGGNALELYAALHGISTKEAYKKLVRGDITPVIAKRIFTSDETDNKTAPIEIRNEVYTALLKMLPLQNRHRHDLYRRGLNEPIIERNMYRTMPVMAESREKIAGKLSEHYDLTGIPGFYRKKDGRWTMMCLPSPGYAVPVRDNKGRIQGIQVRLDNSGEHSKYIWFSSRDKDQGVGAKSWVHLAEPVNASTSNRIWITEGPLKADIAAFYLGVRVIGIPGVSNWKAAVDVIKELKIKEIVIAYDIEQNNIVATAASKLAAALQDIGIKTMEAKWSPEIGKGIDDACLTLIKKGKAISEEIFLSRKIFTTNEETKATKEIKLAKEENKTKESTKLIKFLKKIFGI